MIDKYYKASGFDLLKKWLNKRKGSVFEVRETKALRIDSLGDTTIVKYNLWLMKARYLERVSRGRYKVLREIPMGMTTKGLEREAYPNTVYFHKEGKI